jgi:hypothetical protein
MLKISDWTGNTYQDRRYMNKYNAQIGAGGTQYAYYHEEDESSFQLVSNFDNFYSNGGPNTTQIIYDKKIC